MRAAEVTIYIYIFDHSFHEGSPPNGGCLSMVEMNVWRVSFLIVATNEWMKRCLSNSQM